MIAESPVVSLPNGRTESTPEKPAQISVQRVVAALQVVLATRRAARSEDHAYWYTVARGM